MVISAAAAMCYFSDIHAGTIYDKHPIHPMNALEAGESVPMFGLGPGC